jgi:hypothetical protein
MVDQMQYGFGETGAAMRDLLEAYFTARTSGRDANAAYGTAGVQSAIRELTAQQSNTTQVLRRLEFGTAVSGAPKGSKVLIAMR